jgi:hypothetical protein
LFTEPSLIGVAAAVLAEVGRRVTESDDARGRELDHDRAAAAAASSRADADGRQQQRAAQPLSCHECLRETGEFSERT